MSARREEAWDPTNPTTLVIACSDGRFQEELDDFLRSELGVRQYDRLYVPGGAGALSPSGIEFSRASTQRNECRFLMEAHGITRVILLVHGPAPDGPTTATCGDYRRLFPDSSSQQIRAQQAEDLAGILQDTMWSTVDVEVLRCEVDATGTVEFVRLGGTTRER